MYCNTAKFGVQGTQCPRNTVSKESEKEKMPKVSYPYTSTSLMIVLQTLGICKDMISQS